MENCYSLNDSNLKQQQKHKIQLARCSFVSSLFWTVQLVQFPFIFPEGIEEKGNFPENQ